MKPVYSQYSSHEQPIKPSNIPLNRRLRLLRGNLPLQRREIKRLTRDNRPLGPGCRPRRRAPPQRTYPRLDIPPDREGDVRPLRKSAGDIADLVLCALAAQTEHAGRCGVLLRVLGRGALLRAAVAGVGLLGEEALAQRGEGVRRLGGLDDGVPDDGFGVGEEGGFLVGGGVGGVDVDEELLGVPVEEGGEVWLEWSVFWA